MKTATHVSVENVLPDGAIADRLDDCMSFAEYYQEVVAEERWAHASSLLPHGGRNFRQKNIIL